MISLFLFGKFVEAQFVEIFHSKGKLLYLLMYVLALLFSLLPSFVKHRNDYQYRSLGASGAVSAVIFAGLLITPGIEVGLFLIPPIIPGFIFAPLYLGVSFYLERRGRDNINHSAHIWGALFGLVYVIVVGKLVADFNAIQACIEGIKQWMRIKGWY